MKFAASVFVAVSWVLTLFLAVLFFAAVPLLCAIGYEWTGAAVTGFMCLVCNALSTIALAIGD